MSRQTVRLLPTAVLLVVLCVFAVEMYGFHHGHLFDQHIWDADGLKKLVRLAGWFTAVAGTVLILAPWALATLTVAIMVVLTMVAVGPMPVFAVALFLVSACALGMRLLGRATEESGEVHGLAALLGAAVYILLMTAVARLPVNYAATWSILLAIPILADPRGCGRRMLYWGRLLRGIDLRTWGERAGFALLSFVLLMHWLIVLKPERSADGLAMHLAIPANIARYHQFTFRPSVYVWSVMPMGADWVYSIVYLLGGEFASRLVNYAALLLVLVLIYWVVRRYVSRAVAFLLVASLAATPLVQLVTGSLFVENLLAAMILGMLVGIWRYGSTGERKFLFAAMFVGGTALAIKTGAAGFVVLTLPFVVLEIRRPVKLSGRRAALSAVLAVALFCVAAIPTYAIAWRMTGNPIFPYHNMQLHSPLIDPTVEFQDNEFRAPLTWHTAYDLTFHTHSYYESQDGAFGFQYLLLLPLVLVGAFAVKGKRTMAVAGAMVGIGASALVLHFEPNARYCYAAFPLLLVPFAALLQWLRSHGSRTWQVLLGCIALATLLNIYFLPASGWYQKDFYMRAAFSKGARGRFLRESAPVRKVMQDFNRAHYGEPIFLAAEDDIADASGDVYLSNWHQFPILAKLRQASSMSKSLQLLHTWGVRYFVGRKFTATDRLEPDALRQLVERCTITESEFADFYVSRLDGACDNLNDAAMVARQPSQPAVVLPAGFYDDFDPGIWYRGNWSRRGPLDGAWANTATESGAAGAEISFAFTGAVLTWLHSRGPGMGLAEITIDGKSQGVVELSAPRLERQIRSRYCCFEKGPHVVTIRVEGTGIVDLDCFMVE